MGCGATSQAYTADSEKTLIPFLVILYTKMQIVGGSPYLVNLIINVTTSRDPLWNLMLARSYLVMTYTAIYRT